jgi:PhnB protein
MATRQNQFDTLEKVQAVPDGYHTVTPWIIVDGAAKLLDFLKAAFGAEETGRVYNEDGKTIGHAEVRIGDSVVMLFDAKDTWPPTPSFLRLYVEDGDGLYERALKAGAISVTEMGTHMFGDRVGRVRDPFGNLWWIQTHVEDVSPVEQERRMQEWTSGKQSQYADTMRDAQDTLIRELDSRKQK